MKELISHLDGNKLDVNLVGNKASLISQYSTFSPVGLVIAKNLYISWTQNGNSAFNQYRKQIGDIAKFFQSRNIKEVIIRSSSSTESIHERGKYNSSISTSTVTKLVETIESIFEHFNNACSESAAFIALLIQEFRKPKLIGHLSNERRVDLKKLKWKIEIQDPTSGKINIKDLTVSRGIQSLDHSIIDCLNVPSLHESLKSVAEFFTNLNQRYHIEWVWDGSKYWIVQIDVDEFPSESTKPGHEWKQIHHSKPIKEEKWKPEVFETLDTSIKNWHKIECLRTFRRCKLPYGNIYILENDDIIRELSEGKVNISLKSDLKRIMKWPVTIRSDKLNSAEVLLPRSDTAVGYDEAVDFLINTSKDLVSNGLNCDEIGFLMHRFIISKSGALSFAKPNLDRVRIDSTWGLVEGLYYHPHDSFEYVLDERGIKKKLRCKSQYIDVNEEGQWLTKFAGPKYDWKPSLTNIQIKKIAEHTQVIADKLNKPVTVMFFINDTKSLYPEILPWFYEEVEIPQTETSYTESIFSDISSVIRSKKDFNQLKELEKSTEISKQKKRIKLVLGIADIRNKQFIQEVGKFAKEKNYMVEIEGSILSHPYYVLQSMKVDVRCVDPLEAIYGQKDFYKLVRDKIPVKIEGNEENVIQTKVSPQELIKLLKEKIVEEALEMYWSSNNDDLIEETADALEVIRGMCKAFGIKFKEIEKIADKKKSKRGGFEEGVFLIATKENSLFKLIEGEENKLFSDIAEVDFDIKIKPRLEFFKEGKVSNYKSLTPVSEIKIPYVNNYASKSNSFRYPLKDENFDVIEIEYRDKDIMIKLEKKSDINPNDRQLDVFRKDKKV